MQDTLTAQRESHWDDLLAHLHPWELHALLTARLPHLSAELYFHDEFVAGNLYLRDVYTFLQGRLV